MNKRYENLSDDELRALCDDLSNRVDLFDQEGQTIPDDLLKQEMEAGRELSRREALATRRTGGYSVVLKVEGEEVEYELKALTLEDAQKEAESGAEAIASVTKASVTVDRILGPINSKPA
ncbi:hypothetical protein [Modicisalibacter luteus]|uniref:Uncharacterized protein n=1 Tax=Modicisalibacter luteus TaxID=453962 RepID=A0ABV7M3T5_9GAMM|nr:hypothetical protein [Halomonas lutea]GHB15730.1 hypothetical protein GCM10007159_42530 [Halomonas lutea]